jgi:hypothetical protein
LGNRQLKTTKSHQADQADQANQALTSNKPIKPSLSTKYLYQAKPERLACSACSLRSLADMRNM